MRSIILHKHNRRFFVGLDIFSSGAFVEMNDPLDPP
jgi:hypothetical protein